MREDAWRDEVLKMEATLAQKEAQTAAAAGERAAYVSARPLVSSQDLTRLMAVRTFWDCSSGWDASGGARFGGARVVRAAELEAARVVEPA